MQSSAQNTEEWRRLLKNVHYLYFEQHNNTRNTHIMFIRHYSFTVTIDWRILRRMKFLSDKWVNTLSINQRQSLTCEKCHKCCYQLQFLEPQYDQNVAMCENCQHNDLSTTIFTKRMAEERTAFINWQISLYRWLINT